MTTTQRPRRVYGKAGGSLTQGKNTWHGNSARASVGRDGEIVAGMMLNRLADTVPGMVVLHDLRIPIPGISANIDHVVVSGPKVWILDTKVWAPGVLWTMGGKTYRGLRPFRDKESGAWIGDKKTLQMAFESLSRFLPENGAQVKLQLPQLLIFPSTGIRKRLKHPGDEYHGKRVNTWLYHPIGARSWDADTFFARAPRMLRSRYEADPAAVSALSQLLIQS